MALSQEVDSLIDELKRSRVELWNDQGRLGYRAPEGAMTSELKARVRAHKDALLVLLAKGRALAQEVASRTAVDFPLAELPAAYLMGYTSFVELGELPAQIYLEFDLDALDLDRADRVAARLIARHEALRVVVSQNGRQRIADETSFSIARVDLRGAEQATIESARREARRRLSSGALDPFAGRLFVAEAHSTQSACVLFVCISLMILDGSSLRILLEEALKLYRDPDAVLPPMGISYREYTLAIERSRESESYRSALGYWRDRMPNLPGAPEIPQNPLQRAGRDRFTRRVKRLNPPLWSAFKAQCQHAGVTASAALCAAYASVIASYSRRPRFLLNLMHFNRPPLHPDVGRVVGNFASTLMLEVDFAQSTSIAQRASQLHKQLLEDLEHAAVSGMVVTRELNLAEQVRPRARAPIVFASALDKPGAERLGWLDRLTYGALHTPHVWLDHQVLEDGGTVVLNWDAVEELFPEGLLDGAFKAYCNLIERLSQSQAPWDDVLDLLPAEHAELVASANDTEVDLPPTTLPQLVLRSCEKSPGAIAVVAEGRTLTYAELRDEASQLSCWLLENGMKAGQLVAVVARKGWEQVVAAVAIVQAGGAYLPVDPELPAERIEFLLGQCETGLALTDARAAAELSWPASSTWRVVTPGAPPASEDWAARPPSPDQLAYVIFTSGSTGTPKGVMISHRGAVNTIQDLNARFGVGVEDRVLALSSLSFDLSVYDVFGLLGAGGTVVIPPASRLRDAECWLQLLADQRVTIWNSVPALAELLVEYARLHGKNLPESLRLVMMSGDWIPVGLPVALRGLRPGLQVMSLGGATEASIWSIAHPTDDVAPDAPSIPYGKALANQHVYVLDQWLQPRPVWVTGDIYIGGVGVALGYFRDPVRTAERFIVHPISGERLYRTGDLGRLLPDGTIEFLGREDSQVKVQGYRIELGEIERTLESAPGVRSAVVTTVGESREAKALVAYVVPVDEHAPPRSETLQEHLASKLPAYMVPSRFVCLAALPLTANGKVDRGALARIESKQRRTLVPPRNEFETRIAALWSEVLGKNDFGVDDDFFSCGGYSLLVVRLSALIGARLERDVGISALVSNPTVAKQAELVFGAADVGRESHVVLLAEPTPNGQTTPLFLLHPVGGNVVCYRELAEKLRRLGPVYGVHATDSGPEATALEVMAEAYLRDIRATQPHGPYRLGGWSLGGLLAIEVARILRDENESVELLFTIDSRMPLNSVAPSRAQLLARFVADLNGGALTNRKALEARLDGIDERDLIAASHGFALDAGVLPSEVSRVAFERMYSMFERNALALYAYRMRAGVSPSHSFAASEAFEGHGAPMRADRASPIVLDGDHYDVMREPALERIASTLLTALSEGSLSSGSLIEGQAHVGLPHAQGSAS